MTEKSSRSSTRNVKVIQASSEVLYRAFTDPASLAVWLVPGDMTGKVHGFTGGVGGYEMSLYYPSTAEATHGKTSEWEDRYAARFVELSPYSKIIEAITFNSTDPAFAGEMIMEVTFEAEGEGTRVSVTFTDIPPGIRPEDNEAGTEQSLEKLARYVAQGM